MNNTLPTLPNKPIDAKGDSPRAKNAKSAADSSHDAVPLRVFWILMAVGILCLALSAWGWMRLLEALP